MVRTNSLPTTRPAASALTELGWKRTICADGLPDEHP